jgi:hypothetical protein
MCQGAAEVVPVGTASQLAQVIAALRSHNALALGIPDHTSARVVTTHALAKMNGRGRCGVPVIARTRDFIDYRPGPSWMLLDFDKKGMPAAAREAIAAAGGMWQALLSVVPGLAAAARVTRASTSSGLRRQDTGEHLAASGGEHIYILAANGTDIDRAMVALHDLCWLHGLGWFLIGSAGQMLERSVIDPSVRFGERLSFEGPPEVIPPLIQDASTRMPVAHDGVALDTRATIPSLTAYQHARVVEAKQRARAELEPQAAVVRADADQNLATSISDRTGVPFVAAMRMVAARHNGVLLPSIMLDFDHHGFVTVGEVLAEPGKFVDETLADPLEGADYGRDKAKVLRSKTEPTRIFIHSFAHGRILYDLRHDAGTIHAAVDAAAAKYVVSTLCSLAPQAELEPDELAELIAKTAAKANGVGVRAIQLRLKTERSKREQAARKSAHDQASLADGRLSCPLPFPDGELTPIVNLVDETLASDISEEPPMRNADGKLAEVHVREPWGLHLLTATGSNAEPELEGQQALPAPPEPMLVNLTAIEAALLIEKHIRFETEPTEKSPSRAAALQRRYIDALMSLSAGVSKMPEVRAVVTTPMVAKNGYVMAGVGLDRGTKLVYRIEPMLLACLPSEEELTEEHVREALQWLLEKWLVDVNADMSSKLQAVMNALSKIERVLLRERPAWFFTAGHRGGGKTTLIGMINIAVFGRPTAAAAWSDNEEERRKALFSYLRQGVASICWDNIPRGTQISSAAIEKALTSPETSDRILGESNSETVPSTTIQDFTGNNIDSKGDMTSRRFRIVINVDRPDPENREFAHPDPIGWTIRHRSEILKRLYTILIYGCRSRPADQVAKTRFKDWWSLCGWPVELGASLIGEKIDCAALLAAGESIDEETCAAGAVLSILKSEFGLREFTAKDIVKILEEGVPTAFGMYVSEAAKEKAERLIDALGEMLGKRLVRPTPGTVGILLKNRLVDRPTYIDGSNTAAALKVRSEKHTNHYHIDLLPDAGGKHASPDPAPVKTSPTSPTSPTQKPNSGISGGTSGVSGGNSGQSGEPEHVISPDGETVVPPSQPSTPAHGAGVGNHVIRPDAASVPLAHDPGKPNGATTSARERNGATDAADAEPSTGPNLPGWVGRLQ